ncbi:MAG: alpha/beta fold hydrolase [Comamonadaceae bacterium]|nr:MAG: alpha/beta fold hydrolase [Comamonadaceae bacterium]
MPKHGDFRDSVRPLPPASSRSGVIELGDFALESGEVIPGLRMSYVTFGRLNADKSNVILSLHGLGGNRLSQSHWAGPGKALDTDRYFVIQPDTFGVASMDAGATTSPTRSGLNMRFPRFSIRDMVNAEHGLLTRGFGINHVLAVTGTSMGGMQALQWAVSFPGFMEAVVAMLPMARTSRHLAFICEIARRAVMQDPDWKGGDYPDDAPPRKGMGSGWLVQNAFTASSAWFEADGATGSNVAALCDETERLAGQNLQARDWIYRTWALASHDIGHTPGFGGDLLVAARAIEARVLLLPNSRDQLTTLREGGLLEVAAHIPKAKLVDIDDVAGHRATTNPSPETLALITSEVHDLFQRIEKGQPGISGPRFPAGWAHR